MPEEAMVVAITAISCFSGLVAFGIHAIREIIVRRPSKGQLELTDEIRALRDEVRELRRQNNDLILMLDSPANQAQRRLELLESQARLGAAGEAPQVAGRGR